MNKEEPIEEKQNPVEKFARALFKKDFLNEDSVSRQSGRSPRVGSGPGSGRNSQNDLRDTSYDKRSDLLLPPML